MDPGPVDVNVPPKIWVSEVFLWHSDLFVTGERIAFRSYCTKENALGWKQKENAIQHQFASL